MDTLGMNLHLQAPLTTMASPQSQEQTVCIKLSDFRKIEKKMASYQTRLKAFENLQNLLTKRDEDLTYYKQQSRKFETLYNETLQNNMIAAPKGLTQQEDQFLAYGQAHLFQQQQLHQQQLQQQQLQQLQRQQLQQQQQSPQNVAQSPQYAAPSPQEASNSPQGAPSPQYVTPSPQQVTPSPQYVTPSPQQVTHSPQYVAHSPQEVANSPQQQQQHVSPSYNLIGMQQRLEETVLQQQYQQQPAMPTNDFPTATFENPGSFMNLDPLACSENDRQYLSVDMSSLERIIDATEFELPNVVPAGFNGGMTNRYFIDAVADGEEEPSLKTLPKTKSDVVSLNTEQKVGGGNELEQGASTQPAPMQPSLSNAVWQGVLQNNLRLQKSLRELSSIKGTCRSKLEYEHIIGTLRSKLKEAQDHYQEVVDASSHVAHGDHAKVGEILADYQNKIASLNQIVLLKQSLHNIYTEDGYKASDQKPCKDVKSEGTQASDIDKLTDTLSHTSLDELPMDKSKQAKPEVDAEAETEAARLSDEIAAHRKELELLQEHVERLTQEVRMREDVLVKTNQEVKNQSVRLRQTKVEADKKEALHDDLRKQCSDQEAKLNRLNRDISKKAAQTDNRVAEQKYEAELKETSLLKQMQSMKCRHQQEMESVYSQNKKMCNENEKLHQQILQLKQHYDYRLKAAEHHTVRCGPVLQDQPWMSSRPLPTVVTQDGQSSSLDSSSMRSMDGLPVEVAPPSRRSSGGGSAGARHGEERETQLTLNCPRCLRQFSADDQDYYRKHVTRCTDS